MERLTYWCDDGKGGGEWRINVCGKEVLGAEIDRLAAYEDTGLEPDTVSRIRDIVLDISGDIDHLRNLVQAALEAQKGDAEKALNR